MGIFITAYANKILVTKVSQSRPPFLVHKYFLIGPVELIYSAYTMAVEFYLYVL